MMLSQESVWADTDMWKPGRRLLFRDSHDRCAGISR